NESENLLENMAEGPSCSTAEPTEPTPTANVPELQRKRRPPRLNRLTIHSAHSSILPPSPLTPSSIFSFELTDSPGFHGPPSSARKLRISRNRATPSSAFNFEFDLPPIEELDGENSNSRRSSKGRNSIMTIHRINQVIPVTNWKSVRLIALVLFIIRVQFTVYFASFQPMVKAMDGMMDHEFYALINALYSLGVAMSAPVFGVLANKFGFRRPALLTFFIMFWSNIGFIFLGNIPAERRYFAMVFRFFVGIAAGGSSILNTYWVTVTQSKDAATAAAYTDAAMSLGLAFGPLIQLISSQVDYPGVILFSFLHINMYTIPAMIAIVLIAVASVLIICCHNEEKKPEIAESDSGETCSKEFDSKSDEDVYEEPPLDCFALFLCFLIRFMQSMFYANVETNNPSFITWMFDFTGPETSKVGSAICSASGFLGFGFLVLYVWTGTAKKVNNRLGVLLGFVICLIFLLGSFAYPSYEGFIRNPECKYTWCAATPAISLPLFIIVYLLLFSFGFPLLNVHTSALLAKQLAGRKQAHWHGLSTFIGTASRVVAAPIMAKALQEKGIVFTWYLQIGLIAPMILIIILSYNRLGTPLRLTSLPLFRRILKKNGLEPEKNAVVE
ncbi:hypothetical protein PENTCL1PPCAC_12354, partial [Pristionchus entomophagus]